MALSRPKSASNVMPTRRNGSEISQTNGHKINAIRASGQHRTSRMSQPTKASMAVLLLISEGHE